MKINKVIEKFFEDVYNKDREAVSSFVQNGNNVNVVYDGKTALHIACVRNDLDMIKLLLDEGANPNVVARDETPLHIAVRMGNVDMLKLLVKNNARVSMLNYGTPLYDIFNTHNLEIMKILLKEGANANEVNFTGKPILNYVSQSMDEKDVEFVETLLKYGANPNIDDHEIGTALHNACISNNIAAMDKLLNNNASVLRVNSNGELPLHIACSINSTKAVQMLLKHDDQALEQGVYSLLSYYNKANNRDGHTPLQIARINNNSDIEDMLYERNKNAIIQCIVNNKFGRRI